MNDCSKWLRGRELSLWCRLFSVGQCLLYVLFLSSCSATFEGAPERLYSREQEYSQIKYQLGKPDFISYSKASEFEKISYRNNYISARMYAIDMAYTEYERDLTTERQATGFAGATAILGLNTAATLFTPASTKTALSALSAGVVGARSSFTEEVLMKNTIDIVQAQMRANRAEINKNIIQRMRHDTATYPLAMAMSDVEEYYRAGTLTGGLVKAQATVSAAELLATQEKAAAMAFSVSTRPSQLALEKALAPGGVVNKAVSQKLAAFLAKEAPGVMVSDLVGNPSRGDLADRAAIAIGLTF